MNNTTIFGYELTLDLFECNDNIKSKKMIKQYAEQLCKLIKMKPYGKPLVPFFGLNNKVTKGHTLVQLIETSSLTAHFSEYLMSAYINIFSCKKYNQDKAAAFTYKFFGAQRMKLNYLIR